MAEPTFLKLRPKYILVVQYGDPNSNEALKTSFGIFDSREEADDFRETVYTETNHICDIIPLNDYKIMEKNNG
tara:strand:- start:475 stop:693 length:219 start_codon:yes stop_codon:yes gene_type:complete